MQKNRRSCEERRFFVMGKTVGETPTLLELFCDERSHGFLDLGFGGFLFAEPGAA